MNTTRVLILGGLAVLAILVLLPGASAQIQASYSCETDDTPNSYIRPITQRVTVPITCTMSYSEGSTQPTQDLAMDVVVNTPSGGSWLTTTRSKQTLFFPVPTDQGLQGGGDATETASFDLFLIAGDSATAYEQGKVSFDLSQANDPGASSVDVTGSGGEFALQADYYSVTSFRGQTILKGSPNSPVVFPITIVNDGNGETVYNIDVQGSREEWSMTYSPPQLTIQPSQTAGKENRGAVTVSVLSDQSTQYSNDLGQYTIKATAQPKSKPPGRSYDIQPVSLNAIVHMQGVYVPGFGLPATLAALGAAGIVSRRVVAGPGKD